jgi:hypothetical protein
MNESNNNFKELKQLLKLKRHEIPPPGYFNNFSGDVIARIRAGEASGAGSFFEQLNEGLPWLGSLLRLFETKPGMIGASATALCLLLVVSVVMADRPETAPATGETGLMASAQNLSAASPATMPEPAVLALADNTGITVSTNPVSSLQPVAGPFGQNPLFQSQPASFVPGGQ